MFINITLIFQTSVDFAAVFSVVAAGVFVLLGQFKLFFWVELPADDSQVSDKEHVGFLFLLLYVYLF